MLSRRRFSITTLLIGGFGTLMIVAVGAVFLIGFDTARRNTQALWVTQAGLQIQSLEASLADVLLPVTRQSEWIQDHFESGKLRLGDWHALDQFMTGALGGTPQVAGIGVVDAERHEPTLGARRSHAGNRGLVGSRAHQGVVRRWQGASDRHLVGPFLDADHRQDRAAV